MFAICQRKWGGFSFFKETNEQTNHHGNKSEWRKWIIPDFLCLSLNVVFFPYRQNCWCEWYSLASKHRPMSILSPWFVDPMLFSMCKFRCSLASVFCLQNKKQNKQNNSMSKIWSTKMCSKKVFNNNKKLWRISYMKKQSDYYHRLHSKLKYIELSTQHYNNKIKLFTSNKNRSIYHFAHSKSHFNLSQLVQLNWQLLKRLQYFF